MNRPLALVTCVLLGAAGSTQAQDLLNIRTNPLTIVGNAYVNLELDVRWTDSWSLCPTLLINGGAPLFEMGLRATHFEQGAFHPGWMTGLELTYAETIGNERYYDSERQGFCHYVDDQIVCTAKADQELHLSINHGYLWRWDAFNLGLGFGGKLRYRDSGQFLLGSSVHFSLGWVR
jgi:hypothetical protein